MTDAQRGDGQEASTRLLGAADELPVDSGPPRVAIERAQNAVAGLPPFDPLFGPTLLLGLFSHSKTEDLQQDKEHARIADAVAGSPIAVEVRAGIKAEDLFGCLREHRPEMVHFSGHGAGEDGLLLQNLDDGATTVDGPELAHCFKSLADQGIAIRVVVLNACLAEQQARAIAPYVDYVIGTRLPVYDDSAITFAYVFYDALTDGMSVPDAFEYARSRCGGDRPLAEGVFRLYHSADLSAVPPRTMGYRLRRWTRNQTHRIAAGALIAAAACAALWAATDHGRRAPDAGEAVTGTPVVAETVTVADESSAKAHAESPTGKGSSAIAPGDEDRADDVDGLKADKQDGKADEQADGLDEPQGHAARADRVISPGNHCRPAMLYFPGDRFMMGSPDGEPGRWDNETQHRVQLSDFWLAETPITREQYMKVTGRAEAPWPSYEPLARNPDGGPREDLPATHVSWVDAASFCNLLSAAEGLPPAYDTTTWERRPGATGYRLATEAEWEYVARCDSTAPYPWTTEDERQKYVDLEATGIEPVKERKKSRCDTYAMIGNVAEWVEDWADDYEIEEPVSVDPVGPERRTEEKTDRAHKIHRGAGFTDDLRRLRFANRASAMHRRGRRELGFRIARSGGGAKGSPDEACRQPTPTAPPGGSEKTRSEAP